MADTITGVITYVSFSPQRDDGLTYISLDGRQGSEALYTQGKDIKLTIDGKAVSRSDLFAWLAKDLKPVTVVLHPRPDRYMASTQAEFTRK